MKLIEIDDLGDFHLIAADSEQQALDHWYRELAGEEPPANIQTRIVPDDELVGIWDEETDTNEVKVASEWVLGLTKPTVVSTTCC